MSTVGRGRGYSGRHHLRDSRPGDSDNMDAVRALAELSPRATDTKAEQKNETADADPVEHKEAKPMQEVKPVKVEKTHSSAEDDAALQELLYIDDQYAPLLALLEQFSPGEDGIQFNRKLKHFESTITTLCPDENRLQQAFSTFRAAALLSPLTSRKLSAVGASFTRQQRQQQLRGALLNVVMQGTYSKLDVLERANPLFLINAANLMGDYFAEARLCNGNKVHILAGPLLHYLRALLACSDIRAHRSLATQLMQNGRELLSTLAQELDDLSISIRLRLLTPPPGVSIIWLLLSADLCLNKFMPLPGTLQRFYASHLDLTAEEPQFSEVSYGSWKKSPEEEKPESSPDVSTEAPLNVSNISLSVSSISLNQDGEAKPKLRPILGAGAGLLRQEQAQQENFDSWTTKNSLSKRYDLNSWREAEKDKKEEEPVFNPSVLPPNIHNMLANMPPQGLPINLQNPPPIVQNLPHNMLTPNMAVLPQNMLIPPPAIQNAQVGMPPNLQNLPSNMQSVQTLPSNIPPYMPPNMQNPQNIPPNTQNPSHTLPHQVQNYPVTIPDYPPPGNFDNYPQEKPANYLQQGDGTYIQSQQPQNSNFNSQGDGLQSQSPPKPEKVSNELQKATAKKPIENWRKEKSDVKEDANKNRRWSRQSRENLDEESHDGGKSRNDSRSGNRLNRRNSSDNENKPRRHVTEVPRSNKYWDHDDRCDKDYSS